MRTFQLGFQLIGCVKVVFNGAFATACDKDHVTNASRVSLFNGILNERLVNDGQHLLGGGFGGRQEPSSQSGNREHCFSNTGLCAHLKFLFKFKLIYDQITTIE